MRTRKTALSLILFASICVMIYTGPKLLMAEQVYREGNSAYFALREQVKKSAQDELFEPTPQASAVSTKGTAAEEAPAGAPAFEIDHEALRALNEDAAAWLYCPNTAIDYPVMRADDYNYYLYHLPDGTQNANGSLFIDYSCAADFSDELTVVYGHNMKSGHMFGSLKRYKEQRYFDENPYMYLFTRKGNYRIELLYGCVIGAEQWRERAFMYAENIDALIAYAAHNTTFISGAEYAGGDRIAAMSTCSYEFDGARYVIIGVLRGEE